MLGFYLKGNEKLLNCFKYIDMYICVCLCMCIYKNIYFFVLNGLMVFYVFVYYMCIRIYIYVYVCKNCNYVGYRVFEWLFGDS